MKTHQNVVSGSFRKGLVARLISRFGAWNQRRLAIRELEAMPDVFLRDIGIERFQIRDVVNQSAHFVALRPQSVNTADIQPLQKAAA